MVAVPALGTLEPSSPDDTHILILFSVAAFNALFKASISLKSQLYISDPPQDILVIVGEKSPVTRRSLGVVKNRVRELSQLLPPNTYKIIVRFATGHIPPIISISNVFSTVDAVSNVLFVAPYKNFTITLGC